MIDTITVIDGICRERECEESGPSSTSEESNTTTTIIHSPTARVTTMTSTESPSTDREEPIGSGALELITTVVPAVGGAVLLVICLLVVVIVCCSCLCKIKKRRRKSLHIGIITSVYHINFTSSDSGRPVFCLVVQPGSDSISCYG